MGINGFYHVDYELNNSYEFIGPWQPYECTCGKIHQVDQGFFDGNEALYCLSCNRVTVVVGASFNDNGELESLIIKEFFAPDIAGRLGDIYSQIHKN